MAPLTPHSQGPSSRRVQLRNARGEPRQRETDEDAAENKRHRRPGKRPDHGPQVQGTGQKKGDMQENHHHHGKREEQRAASHRRQQRFFGPGGRTKENEQRAERHAEHRHRNGHERKVIPHRDGEHAGEQHLEHHGGERDEEQRGEQGAVFHAARRLADSKRTTPAATDTLRLSTSPRIGMRTSRSQLSRVRRRMPSPSAPSTQATASGILLS